MGLAGRKQELLPGPPPHPKGWRRSRRGLPWARAAPTGATWCWSSEGCFPDLPAPPLPTLTASLSKPEGLQTGPVLPGFPRPQSLGQRNGALGQAPSHPDCDPSLQQLSPKVTSSPTFKQGSSRLPPQAQSPGRPLLRTWESPTPLWPHFLVRESGEMWRTPASPCHQHPLGAMGTLLRVMTQKSPPEDHLHWVGTSPVGRQEDHGLGRGPPPGTAHLVHYQPALRQAGARQPQSQDTQTQLQDLDTPSTPDGGLLPWILHRAPACPAGHLHQEGHL